ncbi:leucine-rich repeat protein [Clostridium sp. LP20]|uniref:leucine-rich repeat protein n=1 Tax=Clostridium sp. LP20 TaxID=3418665 RepID=UPI003EE67EC6
MRNNLKRVMKGTSCLLLVAIGIVSMPGYKALAEENSKNNIVITKDGFVFDKLSSSIIDYKYSYKNSGTAEVENIKIPEEIEGIKVRNIKDDAFKEGGFGDNLTLPKSILSIEGEALTEAGFTDIFVDKDNPVYSSIDGVLFNKEVTELIRYPMTKGDKYSIPDGTLIIGPKAFKRSYIKEINLPDSINEIGYEAFTKTQIQSFEVSPNVERIGEAAFKDSSLIEKFTVRGPNNYFYAYNGVLFNNNLEKLIYYPGGKKEKSYDVPPEVKEIGPNAFYSSYIEKINMVDGINKIGNEAFSDSFKINEIKLPKTLVEIGDRAFKGTKITNISLAEGLKTIGNGTFNWCGSLRDINIPSTVDSIGNNPFLGTYGLVNIINNSKKFVLENKVLFDMDKTKLISYLDNTKNTQYTIPSGVKFIGDEAFSTSRCVEIILPNTITEIGREAFSFSDITHINIPEGVKVIRNKTFLDTEISGITLPNSIEYIEDEAFMYSEVASINIPKNLKEIGERVFYNCRNMKEIIVDKDNNYFSENNGALLSEDGKKLINVPTRIIYDEYEIPEGVKEIKSYSIESDSLKKIVIPNSIDKVERASIMAFWLENVVIKGALTKEEYDNYSSKLSYAGLEGRELKYSFLADEDVNGDGAFSILDLSTVSDLYNSVEKDTNYNSKIDINKDGIIDLYDIVKISRLL